MPKRTSSYHDSLLNDLRDPQEAANYVNAAIEDGSTETLLLALRNVAEANKMARVAKGAGVTREAIYRMLSRSGNPRLSSLWGVFPSLGLRVTVEPVTAKTPKRTIRRAIIEDRTELSPPELVDRASEAGSITEEAGEPSYVLPFMNAQSEAAYAEV